MYTHDAWLKRQRAKDKIDRAIQEHRPTLMVGGLISAVPYLAKSAYESGVRMFEPNHPAVGLSYGLFPGVHSMSAAEAVRYRVPFQLLVDTVCGIRNMVGEDAYIGMAVPGIFTERVPVSFTQEMAVELSQAGADGFHQHKSNFEDVAELTEIAHRAGLLLDSYLDVTGHLGIQVSSLDDVRTCGKQLEKIGVDLVGVMSPELYKGEGSGEFSKTYIDSLDALAETVEIPVIAEGGIKLNNVQVLLEHDIDVFVISSSIDDGIKRSVGELVSGFLR